MACCRHPLAIVLKRAGYKSFAAQIEAIVASDESGTYKDKQARVHQLILSNLKVSPAAADRLVDTIFDILSSGTRYMHDWGRAYKSLLHSFVHAHDIKETVPQLMAEVAKLRSHWSEIQNIVWAPTEESL